MASTPYVTSAAFTPNTLSGDTSIGGTSTALVAFHDATPTDQYAAITSVATTAVTSTSLAYGFSTSTQGDALIAAVNSLILMAREKGLIDT